LNRRRRFHQLEDEQAAIEICAELRLDAARPGLSARAFGGALGGASPLAFQARVALARLGDERASAHIVRGLSSWSRAARSEAVAAAGQARLEAARARLLEMRHDERQADLRSVAEALLALERLP
jgi:HEAT repeat protein